MNVLFLMQTFVNINESEAMYYSLAKEFVENGHHVTVIASNEGKETTSLRMEGVAKVLRVRTLPVLNTNPFIKGISSLLLSPLYNRAIKRHLHDLKCDLIITPTPPITLTNLSYRLKKKYHAKIFLILRDIFPQNAIDLGILSKYNPSYYLFRAMEKKLYRVSDAIGCMSEGNIEYLLKHNKKITRSKLFLVPNWTAVSKTDVAPESNFARKYDLNDKFIVLFGGNLGAPQRVDNIIEFYKIHKDKEDLIILVIGRGTHKNYFEKLIQKARYDKIIALSHMRRSDYEYFVSIAKVGLISLNEKFTIPNIPSRVLSYYNFRKPVFAITDRATDFGKMLEEDRTGFYCIQGDFENYRRLFDKLYYDAHLRHEMGENGYNALISKYTPKVTYTKIMSILQNQ